MRDNENVMGCGCVVTLVSFNLLVGGWSVDYLLTFFLSENIPFVADMFIGLFTAELSVPVAVVVAVLRAFGVL